MRNPGKGHQRFVDAIVLISITDWSQRLLSFENVAEMPIEFGLGKSNDARFSQTERGGYNYFLEFKCGMELDQLRCLIMVGKTGLTENLLKLWHIKSC